LAQWAGGYSGNTHATRVADAEAALRHAAAGLRSDASSDRSPKAVANVRKLAERLLSARVRMLKARLSAMQDANSKETAPPASEEFASLRARLATVQEQGLPGILAEFDFESLGTERGG
jgi:hypothetical protein